MAQTRLDEVGLLSPVIRRSRERTPRRRVPHVCIFRPAYIYPVEPRKEPNFSYLLFRAIYPAFRLLFPSQVIRADDLARAMVDVAVWRTGERGGLVFENRDIRAMVDSVHPRLEDSPAENGSQKTPR